MRDARTDGTRVPSIVALDRPPSIDSSFRKQPSISVKYDIRFTIEGRAIFKYIKIFFIYSTCSTVTHAFIIFRRLISIVGKIFPSEKLETISKT